jgi:hypothetical protein
MHDEAVQRLLDTEDLKQLKYRYFRLMDAKEWEQFEDLFTEDLEMNFAFPDEQFHPASATITAEGWARTDRASLLAWIRAGSEGVTTLHIAHMPEIIFTGPDTATGTWSMTDYTRWDTTGDPTWYRAYGGHVEDYVRTPAGWKIRRSVFSRHDFDVLGDDEVAALAARRTSREDRR